MATLEELANHERFEIEVLAYLNSKKLLSPLVFGGGTMLRLCHELLRYSADLDFWFFRNLDYADYYNSVKKTLQNAYELTDAAQKKFSILYEIRKKGFPRRLKIEIRKTTRKNGTEEKIAFSRHASEQVLLRAFTLNEMMSNKLDAFLDRKEVRDGFDIEFLLRRGVALPPTDATTREKIKKTIGSLSPIDFKVKLASIIPADQRSYYNQNGLRFLLEKLV